MLYQVVGLIAHRQIRVTYKLFAFFFIRKTGKYVYIAIQQLLIQFAEVAVYILIMPAGILGQLLIVLIGIAGLDSTLFGPLLKHFILIIANLYCFTIIVNSEGARRK